MKNFVTGIVTISATVITIVNVLEKVGVLKQDELPVRIVNPPQINLQDTNHGPQQVLPPSVVPVQLSESPQQPAERINSGQQEPGSNVHHVTRQLQENIVSCEEIRTYMDDTDERIFYSTIKTGKKREWTGPNGHYIVTIGLIEGEYSIKAKIEGEYRYCNDTLYDE